MSGRRIGMDPDRVEAISALLTGAIGTLESVSADIDRLAWASANPLTYGIQPGGLIIAPGAIAGTVWAAASVRGAAGSVRELAALLGSEALAQRMASSGVGFGKMVGRPPVRIPSSVDPSDPKAVAAWWASLDDDERDRILRDSPWTVANLDGIPFEDRVIAHQNWAQTRLEDTSISDEERKYLEQVVAGTVQLVLYDPENDRIIEVIGDLSTPADTVVTYVPGTDAKLGDFYDNSVQQVGRYIEKSTEGTVVFVYKDGPWAQWGMGERGNMNPDSPYAQDRGADLARFQDVVEQEATLRDARTVAVSHSWGTTAMTNSERSGADYDTMISLSGAYVSGSWNAQSGTDYYYLHYEVDALTNAERLGGDSPQSSGHWTDVTFDSGAIRIGDVAIGNGADNHARIARGEGDNREPLKYIVDVIRSK